MEASKSTQFVADVAAIAQSYGWVVSGYANLEEEKITLTIQVPKLGFIVTDTERA